MRRRSILDDNTEDVSTGSSSSKRNRFAKNRRSKREARLRGNRKSGGLLKFTILIIVVSISAAFIIYNIYSAGSSTDDLLYKYTHLSERVVKDSKNQFDKKLHFIKVNEDGTKEISIGFSSDIVKQEVEEEVNNATGGANSSLEGTSITLSADAQKVKQALLNSSYSAKADSMAAIYEVCMSNYGNANMAIGFMINSAHEGNYGVVQYGKTVQKWDGVNSATSTQSNPLIVKTLKNVEALEAIAVSGNTVGVGIVQWTYYTRLKNLCGHYRNAMNGLSTISSDQLMQAENNYFKEELQAYYNSCNATQQASGYDADSIEAWAYAVCVEYEKPQNKKQKGIERANSAKSLAQVLENIQ